jgi:hypothetical protein
VLPDLQFFCVVFCRSLFLLLSFALSVIPFMAPHYPFGIFKLLSFALSVIPFMAPDYPFGIFKLLFSSRLSRITRTFIFKINDDQWNFNICLYVV